MKLHWGQSFESGSNIRVMHGTTKIHWYIICMYENLIMKVINNNKKKIMNILWMYEIILFDKRNIAVVVVIQWCLNN